MEWPAEFAEGVAGVPDLLQRPNPFMHVALNADGVEEGFAFVTQAVQDFVIGGVGAVIVYQQRRLRIGGPGDPQMIRHIPDRPHRGSPFGKFHHGGLVNQTRGFVDHVPDVNATLIARNDIPHAREGQALDFLRVIREPGRRDGRVVPNQRMAFAGEAMLAGPGDHRVGVGIKGLAALALVSAPVEAQRAIVKQRLETLTVLLLQLGLAAVAKHKEVAAEPKVVAELLDLNPGTPDRLAPLIPHRDPSVALAVPFDARAGLSEDVLVGWFGFLFSKAPGGMAEQQSGGGGPGFEECSSIHPDSKQQRGTLLKPKVTVGDDVRSL